MPDFDTAADAFAVIQAQHKSRHAKCPEIYGHVEMTQPIVDQGETQRAYHEATPSISLADGALDLSDIKGRPYQRYLFQCGGEIRLFCDGISVPPGNTQKTYLVLFDAEGRFKDID